MTGTCFFAENYLQKMFSDVKREIREVKPKKVESKMNNKIYVNDSKEVYEVLKERIQLIVAEYIENNDVGDGIALFNKEHELRSIINKDKIVMILNKSNHEIDSVLDRELLGLGYFPF